LVVQSAGLPFLTLALPLQGRDPAQKTLEASRSQFEVDREATLRLTKFIAADLRPFLFVQSPFFLEFLASLNSRYHPPVATTISRTHIRTLYDEKVTTVKQALAQAGPLSLCFDGWTDKYYSRSYLGVR